MLVILPIAAFGSLGFLAAGHLDLVLFLQVLAGQVIGAYVGAKFTRMWWPVSRWILCLKAATFSATLR